MAATVHGLLPGGTDRVENAAAHLREILENDSPEGLAILWIARDAGGQRHFYNSIFGTVLESDLAYFGAILLQRAAVRPE